MDELFDRLAGCFGRVETRKWARAYLTGLLAPVERKNGWQPAQAAGATEPTGIQHFVDRARWDADAVRDAVRSYVTQALAGPQGVLVVDETGFLKKGRLSAGVQRQHSGRAGRVDNRRLGVFLACAAPRGGR